MSHAELNLGGDLPEYFKGGDLDAMRFKNFIYAKKPIELDMTLYEMSASTSPAHIDPDLGEDPYVTIMMEQWLTAPMGCIIDWLVLPEIGADTNNGRIATELCMSFPLAGPPCDWDMYKSENGEAMRQCVKRNEIDTPRRLPAVGFNTRSDIVNGHCVITRTIVRLDYQWASIQYTSNESGDEIGDIILNQGAPYPWCAHHFAPHVFAPLHKALNLNQNHELEDTK